MIEKMKDPFVLYLEKPDDTVLGSINDILDEENSSLSIALNQHYELELTANNTANSLSWYDYIQEGMYVLIGGIGHFKLFHPSINTDGVHETKTVSAQSCDVELEDKTCSYSINMGEETSLEYLVTYDDSETEDLVNPYTGIPYDWIVLYNTFPEQLEAVKTKYNQGYYGTADSSGEITVTSSTLIAELADLFTLIPRLKNKLTEADGETTLTEYVVFSYDGDSTTVTSITLTSDFLSRVETLITFYEKYRDQLSLLPIILAETDGNWTIGEIYGVSDGDYSLANKKYQFEIDETAYAFLTQTFAQTSKCLVTFDILNRKVNVTPAEQIGKDTGIILSYDNLLNSLEITSDEDSLSTRFYVTGGDDLGIEQVNFGRSYIDALDYKLNVKGEDGNRYYISDELAEKYEAYTSGLGTKREQYIQYSKDYANYLTEIDELKYRVPNDVLKTDWGTYTEEELEEALTTYKNLYATLITLYREDYGASHFNDDGTPDENHIKTTIYWWDYRAYVSIIDEIECAISTYPYYSDQDKWSDENLEAYKDLIISWETEWSLYGTIELQAKIDSYTANMGLLEEQSVEIDSSTGEPIAWDDLTDDQKAEYNNLESNYQYDIYKEYYDLRASAQEYLDELNAQLDTLESELETIQTARTELVDSTSWESNFTEDECKILNRLIRDSTYENENILVTSINTTDEKIGIMKELLDDAEDIAFSYSRPQLSFSVSADNLLATGKFKPLWEDFAVGNYMLVQMEDNSYIKLRMTEYSFNPTLPASDNFSLGFSTYVRSRSQVTDIERLLGISSSVGSRGSGGGSGSSSDLDDTISNTLLTKLLRSEAFGTRVKDVILNTIDAKSITARYAMFDNLKDGKTVISGGNIETGSITADKIDVDDLVALEATIGGFAITDISIYSGDKSSVGSTERGIYLGSDGQISFGDSNNYVKYYYDSDDSVWRIRIAAEEITIGASGTSVEEAINSATDTANSAEAKADEALSEIGALAAAQTLYYASSDGTTYPEKPTVEVTASDTDLYEAWNLTLPTYSSDYPYLYICRQSKTNSGACAWSEVEPSTYSDNIAALNGRVETNTANIAINASSIESAVERIEVTETGVSDLKTTVTQTAEDLSVEISDAAKTATDYLLYDDTGLNVGNRSSGSWVGPRAQITGTAYNILDSDGTILASFGSSLVTLGAGGSTIRVGINEDEEIFTNINSEILTVTSGKRIILTAGEGISINGETSFADAVVLSSTLDVSGTVFIRDSLTATGNIFSGESEGDEARTGAISEQGSVYVLSKTATGMGVYAYTTDTTYSKWLVYMDSSGEIRSADAGILIGSKNYTAYFNPNNYVTVTALDAAKNSFAATYMPLSGGTFTGAVTSSNSITTSNNIYAEDTSTDNVRKVKVMNKLNTVELRASTEEGGGGKAGLYHGNDVGFGTGGYLISISTSGTITTNTQSDRRLKNYLGNLSESEASALLENVTPINFTYKGDNVEISSGFFAQDVLHVLKDYDIGYRSYLRINKRIQSDTGVDEVDIFDLDHSEDEVIYGLDYSKFVPVLWKGWQIHKSEIDTLKEEVESLKAEINYLRSMGS